MTVYSETQRKLLHVAMGGFALSLRYLAWPYAAALALSAIVFNAFALRRLAPRIVRETDRRGSRHGLLFYPLAVLLLVIAFPHRLDIAAAAWGVMAFGDGFATLVGKGIGGAALPWNPRKTWSGLLAFVVAGSAGAVALSMWVAPAVAPQPPMLFTLWAPVAAAIVAALVETMPIELDDNLSVPAAAAAVMWFLSQLDRTGALDALLLALLTGIVVSVPIALLAWRGGRITIGGVITGTLFGGVIYAGLFLAGLVVLAVALAVTIGSSRLTRGRQTVLGIADDQGGRRGTGNIVANCLVGTLGAAVELFSTGWGQDLAAAWFVAGIAAGASDTVASEVGKAWGGVPRAFPTLRAVAPGTPGAVSIAGTVAGLAAAALIALPAAMMWLIPWRFVVFIVGACTCGAFLESTLATRFEPGGVVDNHTLNLLNTAAAAALAVWWCSWLLAL